MAFRRIHIRLESGRYKDCQWYFLTMCTETRTNRFHNTKLVAILQELLKKESTINGFNLYAYCFMPNHLHILINGTKEDSDLLRFVKGFKQRSAYSFKQSTGHRLWQKKFYDHILRPSER